MVSTQDRNDEPGPRLWVLLLDAADDSRIAVVRINDELARLYADATSEPWVWCDADSVVITCPGDIP